MTMTQQHKKLRILGTRTICKEPSIHTYFDVNPESPDGQHLCYFRFDGKPLSHGHIIIADKNGKYARKVLHCAGSPHGAAQQGWLDNEHIYFTTDGQVMIADLNGEIIQKFPGAIDTIDQASRRGLAPSKNLRRCGLKDNDEAVYRIDIEDGSLHKLLNRKTAYKLTKQHINVGDVPEKQTGFKHSKWSPDGKTWFVVFTNEETHRQHPETKDRIKVLIAADANGNNIQFIGSFGHHPIWQPFTVKIMAFGNEGKRLVHSWDTLNAQQEILTQMKIEGHPSMHPHAAYIVSDGHEAANQSHIYLRDIVAEKDILLYEGQDPYLKWQTQHPPHRAAHAHPVWSADGQRLYFNAIENEMPQLRVIDFEINDGTI